VSILDKLMSNYTHAVHYYDGDVQKQYRCEAESANDALVKCQQQVGFELQSVMVVTK